VKSTIRETIACSECGKAATRIVVSDGIPGKAPTMFCSCFGCLSVATIRHFGAFADAWSIAMDRPVLVRMGSREDWYLCRDITRPIKSEFACHGSYSSEDACRSVESRCFGVCDAAVLSLESFRAIAKVFGFIL
jgi:hypothetical protein